MLNISSKETSAHRDARVLTYRKTQSTRVSQKLLCLLCASVYPDEEPVAPHPSPRESAGVITQVADGSWKPQALPTVTLNTTCNQGHRCPASCQNVFFKCFHPVALSSPAYQHQAHWPGSPLPLCSGPKPTENRGTPFSSLSPSPHLTPPVPFPGLTS